MKKWLLKKLVKFGVWIYESNLDEKWDLEDHDLYRKLKNLERRIS